MLAGMISSSLSWEYFYYICGSGWAVLLILHCVVIQTDVQESRWLSVREKGLYSVIASK